MMVCIGDTLFKSTAEAQSTEHTAIASTGFPRAGFPAFFFYSSKMAERRLFCNRSVAGTQGPAAAGAPAPVERAVA